MGKTIEPEDIDDLIKNSSPNEYNTNEDKSKGNKKKLVCPDCNSEFIKLIKEEIGLQYFRCLSCSKEFLIVTDEML